MATQKPGENDRASQSGIYETYHKKWQKLYPREVQGKFAYWRSKGVLLLLVIFYALPWFTVDGMQAILFDLPERKFYILGVTFWPQDFIYMTALLIVAALSLFFFTALAGRLWCGYACPQTVWTEAFLWVERKFEGDRLKRQKLDKGPWNTNKILRKGGKHSVWIILALFTGFTFVGYFSPIRELHEKMLTFSLGPWETFWIVFYSFATWGNAGFLREQICIYMCPYARFQAAMFDKNTMIVAYDEARGEARGSRRRNEDAKAKGLGDCIDCTLCVQVCPTGIDIRNGLQYQCIGCAACIDACDGVMEKVGYPKGLIRYTTENAIHGIKTHVMRPRVVLYGVGLVGILISVIYSMATRIPLEMDIIRDRNSLYRETSEGLIQNVYLVKVLNMDNKSHTYKLSVAGIKNIVLDRISAPIYVKSGEVIEVPVRVMAEPSALVERSSRITFHLEAVDKPQMQIDEAARFLGPHPTIR